MMYPIAWADLTLSADDDASTVTAMSPKTEMSC